MSELRKDEISGRWVIIAPERAARPNDFPVEKRRPVGGFCPFCEGNEGKTPPEVFALRKKDSAPDGPGWQVRVVPNRFPALQTSRPLREDGGETARRLTGFGVHEVIIDTPRHVHSLTELPPTALRDLFAVYRHRLLALRDEKRVVYGMVFKNVGVSAGATLEHSHTQLIGMPVVPTALCEELAGARRFKRAHGECAFCRLVSEEVRNGARIVCQGKHFVALTPFASRFPFETWIVPRRHEARFEEHPEATHGDLAAVLHDLLSRMDAALDQPAYNYLMHSAPFNGTHAAHYHWHIEVIPSVTRMAGFEWGTGCYINPVAPESAALFLGKQKR